MSSRVLVFSADELRGKIINKVLDRNGFECLIFNRFLEAGGVIARHAPEVVIFDTENCFSEEINHLRNICRSLEHDSAIVLGKSAVIDRFEGPLTREALCIPDPIDPELIAAKVKEKISQPKKKKKEGWRTHTGSDSLEKIMKHFLNLD